MELILTTKVRTNTPTFIKTIFLKKDPCGLIKTNVHKSELTGLISDLPFTETKVYLIKGDFNERV